MESGVGSGPEERALACVRFGEEGVGQVVSGLVEVVGENRKEN